MFDILNRANTKRFLYNKLYSFLDFGLELGLDLGLDKYFFLDNCFCFFYLTFFPTYIYIYYKIISSFDK